MAKSRIVGWERLEIKAPSIKGAFLFNQKFKFLGICNHSRGTMPRAHLRRTYCCSNYVIGPVQGTKHRAPTGTR